MPSVHRLSVPVGAAFSGPLLVAFGWQERRQEFSVWFASGSDDDARYVVLGTGHEWPEPFDVVATVVLPDGFHAFHLCRIR